MDEFWKTLGGLAVTVTGLIGIIGRDVVKYVIRRSEKAEQEREQMTETGSVGGIPLLDDTVDLED